MYKHKLFGLLTIIFSFNTFAQSSGTFSGTLESSNSYSATYTFVSSGVGKYEISGTASIGGGSITSIVTYVGALNDYNIGDDNDLDDIIAFDTACIEGGTSINLQITSNGNLVNYTLNYQFVPYIYEDDIEPNNTVEQAINTTENTLYEGHTSWPSNPIISDNIDWYTFVAPRNGNLIITLNKDINNGQGLSSTLYDITSQNVPHSTIEDTSTTLIYTYNNFNYAGQVINIEIYGNCTSYQFSWNIQPPIYTTITDSNFEQLLIDLGYDDVLDGEVLTQNIDGITTLDISSLDISDLTGIENFISLEDFTSIENPLSNVDFTGNPNLTDITIIDNPISNIDVTQNTQLIGLSVSTNFASLNAIDVSSNVILVYLELGSNNLSSLDVSNNSQLTSLGFGNNPIASINLNTNTALEFVGADNTLLTDLDLSNNPNIQTVWCFDGQLTNLNLKNGFNNRMASENLILSSLNATNNPNLTCIQVDNAVVAQNNSNWLKDTSAVYSEDCSTLGVNNNSIANQIFIYPNPANEYIKIETNLIVNNIELYDVLGKLIKNVKLNSQHIISLKGLNESLYFLKIRTNKGIIDKKIIKE